MTTIQIYSASTTRVATRQDSIQISIHCLGTKNVRTNSRASLHTRLELSQRKIFLVKLIRLYIGSPLLAQNKILITEYRFKYVNCILIK